MKTDLLVEFIVDRNNKSITVKREYDANIKQAWDAYTKSGILDQWWAPKPWKAKTKSMDFTPGGKWLYAMVGPNGEEHWSVAKFTAIEDQKSFSVEDGFTDAQGNLNPDMPQSHWVTHFSESNGGTLVQFDITFGDVPQLDETLKMGFKEGLLSAMENLDAYFAARK